MGEDIVYCDENEILFDYCLYSYTTSESKKNKIHSSNLMNKSLEKATFKPDFLEISQQIQSAIGKNKTVFGVKKNENGLAWELYFYNYDKKDLNVNIPNILNTLNKKFNFSNLALERAPYFMFSIDLSKENFDNNTLRGIHIYLRGLDRQGGTSYFFDGEKIKPENNYSFFEVKEEMHNIIAKIKNSVFINFSVAKLSDILLPELIDCKTICVANKQEADGIYFSRINIDQFVFFLEKFKYPDNLVSFIKSNKNGLNHLRFDVGFDYRTEGKELKIIKSGYYGTF